MKSTAALTSLLATVSATGPLGPSPDEWVKNTTTQWNQFDVSGLSMGCVANSVACK